MKDEIGRVKLIEGEIGTGLLGMSITEAQDSRAYNQAGGTRSGKELSNRKMHPLTRYFPWEAGLGKLMSLPASSLCNLQKLY